MLIIALLILFMTINFSIYFKSTFGQNIYLCGSSPELGSDDPSKALKCDFNEGFLWTKRITVSNTKNRIFSYYYFVKDDNGTSVKEITGPRKFALSTNTKSIVINDRWFDQLYYAPFFTAPFSDVFYLRGGKGVTKTHMYNKELIISVIAPNINIGDTVCICGDHPSLGEWNTDRSLPLQSLNGFKKEIHLPLDDMTGEIQFKFILKRSDGTIVWEEGDNRSLDLNPSDPHQTSLFEMSMASFPIARPRFAGTSVPLFSLRSKNSGGIGDFNDLKLLADWAKLTRQTIIQLLPVNDTTASHDKSDSYPYNCISVTALHPIYINIQSIGKFKDKETLDLFNSERRELNALEKVDYERVWQFKQKYLRIMFDYYAVDTFARPEQYAFYKKNKNWLLKYAAFCLLRDKFKTADFSKWGKYAIFSQQIIDELNVEGSDTYKEFSFHLFTQFHLHSQLWNAVEYAHIKGVAIKGDIPIGVSPFSVETWSEPSLFNTDKQAGAPPDAFSSEGQNWGFPTYNWSEMRKDDFLWWRNRLSKMSDYFDIYRIDHILGFFRIWEIPKQHISSTLGYFNPALPLNKDEVCDFGYLFNEKRDCYPYITKEQLVKRFGEKSEKVTELFFDVDDDLFCKFKEQFSSQQLFSQYFEKNKKSVKESFELKSNVAIEDFRKRILSLYTEVLFIEDPYTPERYHPRIAAQFTDSYSALNDHQKRAYNTLYDSYFYRRNNQFWADQALLKIPGLISATTMLACAEDLGMIPSCVPGVLKSLNIASLKIQRMPEDPYSTFGNTKDYPYLSVCSTGTHDMSSLRGWWEEDKKKSQLFYNRIIGQFGEAPSSCEPWISELIIGQHLDSPSMFAIIPIQDWFSLENQLRVADPNEERINIPANPKHYWRYRIQIYLEDLIKNSNFNDKISQMVKQSNRSL